MLTSFGYLIIVLYSLAIGLHECRKHKDKTKTTSTSEKTTIIEVVSIKQTQETNFQIPDDEWVSTVLKDIAYYLRNHKFNEWDRRYEQIKPYGDGVGFYKVFPDPPLKFLHWKVQQNCHKNFYKCVIYLQNVIETAPITRKDDLLTMINANLVLMNDSSINRLNSECIHAVSNADKTGTPFDGPIERFVWRSSAAYYMCWYTLLETPALSMLGEPCDNFANCLDPTHGPRNHDPRANDTQSFACAMYSFCPDPCYPIKYLGKLDHYYFNHENPCATHNNIWNKKECKFDRKSNQNLDNIIANKWNISCNCEEDGFIWDSQFGMCVDKNECVIEENSCNDETEDCLNVPGSFKCICKWGFAFDNKTNMCMTT